MECLWASDSPSPFARPILPSFFWNTSSLHKPLEISSRIKFTLWSSRIQKQEQPVISCEKARERQKDDALAPPNVGAEGPKAKTVKAAGPPKTIDRKDLAWRWGKLDWRRRDYEKQEGLLCARWNRRGLGGLSSSSNDFCWDNQSL